MPDGLTFDAVVWGAGPAGAAGALTLTRLGHRVALLDAAGHTPPPLGESLPAAARPLLHRLGVWTRFETGPHRPCYGHESAWGSEQLQITDSLRDPHGHGWLLDRFAFDGTLREAARTAGATLFSASHPAPVEVCRRGDGWWRVTFPDAAGQAVSLSAPWLLDCTGRRSRLARRLGVRRVRLDSLVGHAALFRPDADAPWTTLVEAAPEGWWYTARTPDGGQVVLYFTDVDTPTGRQARSPDGFLSLLADTVHVRERLRAEDALLASGPWVRCAHTARLERGTGEGWLAAGDAALSFDPLSSQGLFHALASGLEAGQAVADTLTGDGGALADYERSQTSVFEAYQGHHAAFYAQEQRWPHSVFWNRRHREVTTVWGKLKYAQEIQAPDIR